VAAVSFSFAASHSIDQIGESAEVPPGFTEPGPLPDESPRGPSGRAFFLQCLHNRPFARSIERTGRGEAYGASDSDQRSGGRRDHSGDRSYLGGAEFQPMGRKVSHVTIQASRYQTFVSAVFSEIVWNSKLALV
jgi:hypothetical protein